MLIQWLCQRRATQEVRASYLECQEDISDLKAYLETRIGDGDRDGPTRNPHISCKMGPHGTSRQVEGGLPPFARWFMFGLNVSFPSTIAIRLGVKDSRRGQSFCIPACLHRLQA